MTRHLRRVGGATALAVAVVLLATAAGTMRASGAPSVVIYEGEARASALHVQATKESLLPVPDALDTFLPFARVRAASPVLRSALASPAYDTNISNLSELLCTASGNQLCPPSVPLTASVEEPGTSAQTPIPPIEAGPLALAGGYAEARASEDAASAVARHEELTLQTRSTDESAPGAAADLLRDAIHAADPTGNPADASGDDALVSTTGVTASSEIVVRSGGVAASATSEAGGVSLLEGLVRIEAVHAEAAYANPGPGPTGGPRLAGVTVGPFAARIDADGIHVADETLGPEARERLNEALARIDELFRVRLGGLEVEPRPDGQVARATGLEIAYRREVVPNTGAEGVRIAVGTAAVTSGWSTTGVPETGTAVEPSTIGRPPDGPSDVPGTTGPSPDEAQRAPTDPGRITELGDPEAAPAGNVLPGLPDFPAGMLVLVLGAALAAATGFALLTGWQVAEE